jgi:hypothetical protein
MHIANPIYDTVFKFMMEDERVAKAFISAIIGEEVVELKFTPQERTVRVDSQKRPSAAKDTEQGTCLTVFRIDFSARISTPDGRGKTVMIELQKAKFVSDVMRFRRYLGQRYQDAGSTYGSEGGEKPCQIYCIFILGYDIGFQGQPVVQVDYRIRDLASKEELNEVNEFILSLHHRSWIVQTGQLKQRRRNDLERLLGIFDQDNRTENRHILNVIEDDFPEVYRPVIRRLRMAFESEQVQTEMEMEDDFLKELQDKERLIVRKEEIIEEQKKTLEEKDKTLEEKDKTIEEKDRELAELRKMLEQMQKRD